MSSDSIDILFADEAAVSRALGRKVRRWRARWTTRWRPCRRGGRSRGSWPAAASSPPSWRSCTRATPASCSAPPSAPPSRCGLRSPPRLRLLTPREDGVGLRRYFVLHNLSTSVYFAFLPSQVLQGTASQGLCTFSKRSLYRKITMFPVKIYPTIPQTMGRMMVFIAKL